MNKKDIAVGDEVFVRLPYDGGCGWATVLDLDADPPTRFARKTETVRVRFHPDGLSVSTRDTGYVVSPARIVKKRTSS